MDLDILDACTRGSPNAASFGILRAVAEVEATPRRPGFLTLVLIVAWFIGLQTLQSGYATLRVLRNPLAGDGLGYPDAVNVALVESVSSHASSAMPIAVAQLLLGGLLLATSLGTLFGGIRRVGYTLQALFANAVLACVAYPIGEPVRDAMVEAFVQGTQLPPELAGTLTEAQAHNAYLWGFRLAFGLHLAVIGTLAWALSRRSVREFLAFSPSTPREN